MTWSCRFCSSPEMLLIVVLLTALVSTDAFILQHPTRQTHVSVSSPLFMAGFGASSSKPSKKSKKTKKEISSSVPSKLKPRQQWDRYLGDDMKDANAIRVAARIIDGKGDAPPSKWYEIGTVKSKDNAHTELAVIRHRVLMAEHARRMFPLQILAKDKLEWGYSATTSSVAPDETTAAASEEEDTTEWTIATKVETVPEDIEKMIGFKGNADPTGFYGFTGSGLKGGDSHSTGQTGFLKMKGQAITGAYTHEIHD